MFWNKIKGKVKKHFADYHDMSEHPGELHYFEIYWHHIRTYFDKNQTVLDIGAQNGRFTVPLLSEELKVTATDIESSFIKRLNNLKNDNQWLTVRKESVYDTIRNNSESFDHILCLELLYTLPDPENVLSGLSQLLQSDGHIFCSHRNLGYYLYRYLREKDFDKIEALLKNNNDPFNHQGKEELEKMYQNAGLKIEKIIPIGMFSGFDKDPWTDIANPENFNLHDLNRLHALETNDNLMARFYMNARYTLVVASKKS